MFVSPGSCSVGSYFKEPFNIISIFWIIIWTPVTFKCCTTTIDFRELSLPHFSLPRCAMIGVMPAL